MLVFRLIKMTVSVFSRADKRIIVHFVIQAPNLAQISVMAYLFEK